MALICMMGLPRSGKSTVARVISEELNAPIVNRDSIRLALHGQRYQTEAEPMVKVIARVMIGALIRAGHGNVVIDETNLKLATRSFWRELAADLNMHAAFLHIRTSKEACLARAQAAGDDVIQPVIEKMDVYTEPLVAETEVVGATRIKVIAAAIAKAEEREVIE